MAEVVVTVPDGEFCNGCRWLMQGTILCQLYDDLVNEEEYVSEVDGKERYKKRKHDYCPRK